MLRTYDAMVVDRLLAGAVRTVTNVRYCWFATGTGDAGISLRPMGRIVPTVGDNQWAISFITDSRSRKALEIGRCDKVAAVFQHDPTDAYVALSGIASLQCDEDVVCRRWKPAYDAYFPTETDRASAAFVDIAVERMELWIRGVTPEPFGLKPAVLERDGEGAWRLAPAVSHDLVG
jgi:general stress protein 26